MLKLLYGRKLVKNNFSNCKMNKLVLGKKQTLTNLFYFAVLFHFGLLCFLSFGLLKDLLFEVGFAWVMDTKSSFGTFHKLTKID